MILSIFIFLSLFALGLAILGTYSGNVATYLTGGLFLFLLGVVVLNAGVETVGAETTNTTYSYLPSNITNTTVAVTQKTYTSYTADYSHYFGLFLALAGAFCLVHGAISVRSMFKTGDSDE